MRDGTTVSVRRTDAITVLTVGGELDISGKPVLLAEVATALAYGTQLIVIDLAAVTFLDAQGLSALVVSRVRAAALGTRLALAEMPAAVRRLMEITCLNGAFVIVSHRAPPCPLGWARMRGSPGVSSSEPR